MAGDRYARIEGVCDGNLLSMLLVLGPAGLVRMVLRCVARQLRPLNDSGIIVLRLVDTR
jgi:hypothetical protein